MGSDFMKFKHGGLARLDDELAEGQTEVVELFLRAAVEALSQSRYWRSLLSSGFVQHVQSGRVQLTPAVTRFLYNAGQLGLTIK